MTDTVVDVALAVPSLETFQYTAPSGLSRGLELGKRVWVSVRARRMVGHVVGIDEPRRFEELKPIEKIIDDRPVMDPALFKLSKWMSEYYLCSWGQAIDAILPAPFKKGRFLMKSRAKHLSAGVELTEPESLPLTEQQKKAYESVLAALKRRQASTFLLHGITGSGKTEIYLQLIRELLAESRGSIVLVPEISLTPQTVDRFYSRFGNVLAVIHSRLPQARRVEEWHRIRSGEAKVVVGARSAVFSPVRDLGLIVIDEEQDTSYKQDETPRYQTRDVARKRAELEGAVVLAGSATPSLELFYDARRGTVGYLELSERIEKRPLPSVEVIDMRRERPVKGEKVFSFALETAVRECVSRGEQAMLFLNRRGFSTYLHCASCGHVVSCPQCRLTLTFHLDKHSLVCHVCHFKAVPERLCPGCQKNYLHYFGMGTQKVEAEAARLFPGARIGRMDSDSTSRKDAHETILRAFKRRQIDLLIGTQMIAKGHDFPGISLIGVISADTALHVPDFRAAERTFSLLTQVSGRAGRGDAPGRVIVQTYVPGHYSIQQAKTHDYKGFFERESLYRGELSMPPYLHLVRVMVGARAEREAIRGAHEMVKLLQSYQDPAIKGLLGPAPCPVSHEAGTTKWHFFIKTDSPAAMRAVWLRAMREFKRGGATVTADVDPQ